MRASRGHSSRSAPWLSALGRAVLFIGALAAIGQPSGQSGLAGPLPAPPRRRPRGDAGCDRRHLRRRLQPSTNYGTSPNLYVALNASPQARVTLVRFDLSPFRSPRRCRRPPFR